MANVFDEMGVYWAEIADKHQTQSQIQFLKTQLKPQGYILDVACGTGRHLIPLSQLGYGMVGLDVSAKLLKIAKERCKQVSLVRGDMRFLPFKAQAFASVISMDTSFGYLPSMEDDRASLAEVRRTLQLGGVFVINVFNRQKLVQKYLAKDGPPESIEYPSFFLEQKRAVTSDGQWLCDVWTVIDKASGQSMVFRHIVRLYERTELEGLLASVGLTVKWAYGGYGDEKYSATSSHLILISAAK